MLILPAIDIRGGKCVRLFQGDYNKQTIYATDPVSVAIKWEKEGAKKLHIIDLDGAKDGKPAIKTIIKEIVKNIKLPVQVGGGIRTVDDFRQYIELGVSNVILGTSVIENKNILDEILKKYANQAVVSIDINLGKIMVHGWLKESRRKIDTVIVQLQNAGLQTLIITDISRDGTLSGVNVDLYKSVRKLFHGKLIAAGGISSKDDVVKLKTIGVDGTIIGKALYENRIRLRDLL